MSSHAHDNHSVKNAVAHKNSAPEKHSLKVSNFEKEIARLTGSQTSSRAATMLQSIYSHNQLDRFWISRLESKQNGTDTTVIDQINRLLTSPSAKGFPSGRKNELVHDIIQTVIDPTSIKQGRYESCVMASVELILATKDPVKYAKTIVDLSSGDGRAPIGNGIVAQLSIQSAVKDLPDSGRTLASAIFQDSLGHAVKHDKSSHNSELKVGLNTEQWRGILQSTVSPRGVTYKHIQGAGTRAIVYSEDGQVKESEPGLPIGHTERAQAIKPLESILKKLKSDQFPCPMYVNWIEVQQKSIVHYDTPVMRDHAVTVMGVENIGKEFFVMVHDSQETKFESLRLGGIPTEKVGNLYRINVNDLAKVCRGIWILNNESTEKKSPQK